MSQSIEPSNLWKLVVAVVSGSRVVVRVVVIQLVTSTLVQVIVLVIYEP